MLPLIRPRFRSKKPKTRTGCRTCKNRRVKCDEEKPSCARCLKLGADCEGYEVGIRSKAPAKRILKSLAPRASHRQEFVSFPLGESPFVAVFQDNREYLYFIYFQEEAALDISGQFDQSLFSHVIIQSSWKEPSLCQLLASLGALYKVKGPKGSNSLNEEEDQHLSYTLQHYGQALRSVQTRISDSQYQDSARVALIASLLIYCWENLYGDHDSAIRHVDSALQFMKKQLASSSRYYQHSNNSSPTLDLEGDLVAAFFRLDSGLLARDDMCMAENIGSRLDISYLQNIRGIPETFSNISEARNYLENIQFPGIPSLSHQLAQIYQTTVPQNMDEKTKELFETMSSQLQQWDVAFAPLYAQSLKPDGKQDIVATATLRVRALSTVIALQRVCASDPIPPDFLLLESWKLLDLSRLVAADPNFVKSFVWDCGIVPGLSIVIAACFNTSIRKEALQILKDIVPRREGVWDSLTAVKFGEGCLQMNGI